MALNGNLDTQRLRAIIAMQTEVAKLGPDLGRVMALVAVRARELTGADGSVIELAEGEDMVYRASAGIAGKQLGLRLKRSESLSGRCVAEDQSLYCEDSETDGRVDREACRRVGLRSMIVSPLRYENSVVGVLKVLSTRLKAFDAHAIELLDLLSGMVAAAMFYAGKLEASELFRLATHDPMTGLANRALFFDRLRNGLECSRRESRGLAVLNLDLDGLKPINDNHGHRAGDAVICAVAERLRSVSCESDTIARMGGDEFAVLLLRANHSDAVKLARRLEESLRAPFEFDRKPLTLSASMGAAAFPQDGDQPDLLLDVADRAMYSMKRSRPGRDGLSRSEAETSPLPPG